MGLMHGVITSLMIFMCASLTANAAGGSTAYVQANCRIKLQMANGTYKINKEDDPLTFHLGQSVVTSILDAGDIVKYPGRDIKQRVNQAITASLSAVESSISSLKSTPEFSAVLWYDDWRTSSKNLVTPDEMKLTIRDALRNRYDEEAYLIPLAVRAERGATEHKITMEFTDLFKPVEFNVPVSEFGPHWTPSDLSQVTYRKLQAINSKYRVVRERALGILEMQMRQIDTANRIEESGYGGSGTIEYSEVLQPARVFWGLDKDD